MNKSFKQILLAAAALLTGALTASATPTEASQQKTLDINTVYHLSDFSSVRVSIDLPAGKLIQNGGADIELFAKSNYTQPLNRTYSGYGLLVVEGLSDPVNNQIFAYDIPEAGTYYAKADFVMNGGYFMFQPETAVAFDLLNTDPTPGSTISDFVNVSGTGEVVLMFSTAATFSQAYLKVGDAKTATVRGGDPAPMMPIAIGQLMRDCYASGIFAKEGGTPFQLVIEGVTTSSGTQYGTDGTITLDYIAAPAAMTLSSTNFKDGNPLLSYYPKGDSRALLVFTFEQDVCTDPGYAPEADLLIGNIEVEGASVYEVLSPVVSGNTVTIDLSGVNRRPAIAAAGIADGEPFSLKLYNIFDKSHTPARGVSSTNVGSFAYTFYYREVPEQTLDYEFLPPSGSSLADCAEITLWHNNSSVIERFDGIKFTYDNGESILLPAADLVNHSTEPDECEYVIPVPDEARTQPVEVEMANIVSTDGYDKSVRASYNKFVITYCSPFAEGATMAEIPYDPWMADESTDPADKLIHIRTNYAEQFPEMVIEFEVRNLTAGQTLHASEMQRLDTGEYVGAWFARTTPLVAGHHYQAVFTAWPSLDNRYFSPETTCLGSYAINFYGSGAGFNYSSVEFESIDPDPTDGSITPSQNVFTITYNGLVMIREDLTGFALGMGAGTLPMQSVEAVDADPENLGYSSVWRLTVPAGALVNSTGLDIHVAAVDQNGLTVAGDMMTYTDQDYKSFSYTIYDPSGYHNLDITPANGSKVSEISTFAIRCDMSMGFNWSCTEPIEIYSMTGTEHTVVRSDDEAKTEVFLIPDPNHAETTYATIRLHQPITRTGSYQLTIPEGYFMLGSQFDTSYNLAAEVTLTVVGGDADPSEISMTFTPANGSVVESVDAIYVWTTAELNPACTERATLNNALSYNSWDSLESWSTTDVQAVEGGYRFSCAAGPHIYGGDYDFFVPDNFFIANGNGNMATYLTFTVHNDAPAQPMNIDITLVGQAAPDLDEPVTIEYIQLYSQTGIIATYLDDIVTVTDLSTNTPIKELGGIFFTPWLGTWPEGFYVDANTYRIPFDPALDRMSAAYSLTIPAGFFSDNNGQTNALIRQEYPQIKDSGIAAIRPDANGTYTVADIAGRIVMHGADASALGSLRPGLYIINGTKTTIK